MSEKFNERASQVLGLGNSKVFRLALRPPFFIDVRSVFTATPEEDTALIKAYLRGLDLQKLGKLQYAKKVAERVNKSIVYQPDSINWKKSEFWAKPYEVWTKGKDDCDGMAVLICYLLRLAGFSQFEVFVRAGECVTDDGHIVGHAHVIVFDWDTNEWYPLEGSFYPKRSLELFGTLPMRFNDTYLGSTYFIANDELSFSGWPIRLTQ